MAAPSNIGGQNGRGLSFFGAASENSNVKSPFGFLGLLVSLVHETRVLLVSMEYADQKATLRSNNSARAAYRLKCRQKLSEHIWTKLGIFIEPGEVRLITSANDPYTWQILPEKNHLFSKQLSKHSIGAYRELCRGVGVSFEAVLVLESGTAAESEPFEERPGTKYASGPETSFTAVIEHLNSDKLKLIAELEESNHQATEATKLKQLAEEEVAYLNSIVQAVEIDRQKLQQEVQTLTGVVEYFRSTTVKSLDEFTNKVKFDLSFSTGKPSVEDSD